MTKEELSFILGAGGDDDGGDDHDDGGDDHDDHDEVSAAKS